jgi:hypothetical protein
MSRVHGTIQRPVCMRTFALQQDAPDKQFIALRRCFSATGHSNQHILIGLSTLPEPESRYGLSLAHNDACATIARSMFLACTFVSASKTFTNPFDSRLFRSVRFRGRTGATSMPGTRFPLHSSILRIHPRSPLPFRPSFENPPDQSVRPVPNPEARLTRRPIVSYSPLLPLAIPLRINARNSLRLSLTYRSVNPGTDSMIVKERLGVKRKMVVL